MTYQPFDPSRMTESDGADTPLSEEVYIRTERYQFARMLHDFIRSAPHGIIPSHVASGIYDIYQRGRREWMVASRLLGDELEEDELAFLNGEVDDV